MVQVQLTKLMKVGLMCVGGAAFGHIGAFAASVLGGAIGSVLGTLASGLGEQTIGLGLENLRQLLQKDPNLSSIIQKALEKSLNQLREQRQKEIGILPDDEDQCFKNWLNALRGGRAWSGEEAEKIGESFLTASEQEEGQILWSLVEGWLKENAGIQVPEPLLRFLKERLPETLQSCLHGEIAENQQVFNQVALSLVTQILQIVRSLPEEVRKTLEPEIQRAVQQIERQQQFLLEVLSELAGIKEQFKRMENLLVERFGISHVATFLFRSTNQFVRDYASKVFVGRKEAFDRLNCFLSGEKGIAIVYAPAGYGKTTFLANWVWKLMVGEWRFDDSQVHVFHHFFNPNLQYSRTPSNAYAHLLAQISFATQGRISVPDRDDERHAALLNFFYEFSAPEGEKWVIVLDGLDDAEGEVLPFIPAKLPKGLFVVISGRWDGEGELPPYLKEWAKFTEFIPLKALSEDEIREWLRKAGEGELARFAENDDFVRMLREKTEGFPLFVRYLMDELLGAVREGKSPEQILERTPSGFSEYVREQFRQLLQLVRNEKGVRNLLALLTVAKGALYKGEVEKLTGLYAGDLEVLPHQVTRWFSIGRAHPSANLPPDKMETYAFAHPLLAEEFRKHLGREAEEMEEKLLEWCEGWREHPSPYILRHYADHLYERWWQKTFEQKTYFRTPAPESQFLYSKMCQLALDTEFAQSQTLHLPDEPNLPLKTVQLALDAAIKLEDAPMMARLLMEHAKRAQIEEETPLQAWRKGHRERALKMATEIIFERDHELGTLWCLLLAWVAESEGEREWVKRFLDEVRKRWEGAKLTELMGKPLDWRGNVAVFLLSEMGQVEEAIEVAGLVLDDKCKRDLATSWASKGLFEQALKVAEVIEDTWRRAWALREITVEMAKAGMFEQAMRIAERIKYASVRGEALGGIAVGMAKVGMFEQAMKILERIENEEERAEALSGIAIEMAKVRMFEQAMKAAKGIKDAKERAWALRGIAEEMAKAGMIEKAKKVFEQATKIAERIKYASARIWALREIAVGMAKAGMIEQVKEVFEQALKTAESIEDERYQVRALREIVVEMAKVGMFEQAMKTTERIEDECWRARILGEVAEEMAKAGMIEKAKEVFEQAMKTAERIENAWLRARALREIAVGMVKAGMFEQAVKTAERIEIARERAEALSEISEEMAKAGMIEKAKEVFEQAMETAERIENAWLRAEALMAKTEMVEKAKEVFEQAMETAERIEDAGKRTWALREIAIEMAKAGIFEQALNVAERIEDAWLRAEALREIAIEIAKAGMFEQAVKTAERIEIASEWAWALREIAVGMAKAGMVEKAKEVVGKAKEVFEQAMKTAERIENAWRRARALSEIAVGMAKAGIFEQAMKTAERIEDERWRVRALGEIAEEMAKAGMFEQAMKAAERIEYAWNRAKALREIAIEIAKAGMFEQAVKTAERIENAWRRAWALSEIAEEMTKAGMVEQVEEVFEQALKTAESIEDAERRAWALREIAKEMAKAGMVEQAMEIAERIEDAEKRAEALSEIAKEMAKAGMEERAKEVFEQAMETAEKIEDAKKRARALREIAVGMAKAGEVEGAVGIVERETGLRTEVLPSVLEALAERAREGDGKSKEGFLRLFPFCGWSLELAYQACGLLAWLYPEQEEAIAKVVSGE
ncbi:hypothetical protein Q2T83_10975 [Fervidibacter sacchari]|uniref:Tetratricopeptide (TPR) repeat protein n=1 Tax=Candidatus Fervidibacter sacchari TaxID=1448929 RepID=A0ABT2ESM3_9BACT|nr:hypothetical protein [Candidatus Fervidibacter sacchari]MCS3920907.1 tetratricopeptide (TPR) repeat protein [Candidatus Fervidibacter sacchari]WKU14858.1 hypothetical protein Q2T83_10975 [Candidatus Fervidibacter sacchari]